MKDVKVSRPARSAQFRLQLDFWKSPSEAGKEVHVMMDEANAKKLLPSLDRHNISHSVMIPDVEK